MTESNEAIVLLRDIRRLLKKIAEPAPMQPPTIHVEAPEDFTLSPAQKAAIARALLED